MTSHGVNWTELAPLLPGKSEANCKALWRKYKWRLGLQESLRAFTSKQDKEQLQQSRTDEEPRAKQQKTDN